MTDFLKTRLLDTLSDQIRKIQKVRECKGSARREATCPRCCSSAPQPGTARGPVGLAQHPGARGDGRGQPTGVPRDGRGDGAAPRPAPSRMCRVSGGKVCQDEGRTCGQALLCKAFPKQSTLWSLPPKKRAAYREYPPNHAPQEEERTRRNQISQVMSTALPAGQWLRRGLVLIPALCPCMKHCLQRCDCCNSRAMFASRESRSL